MPFLGFASSRRLSLAAIAIWLASLPLTGLVLYSQHRQLLGLEILFTGWLSPLVFNFAWFANIFFLYGVFGILSGRRPFKASAVAAFLSLDTFRFSQFLLNEGGSTTPVYGYGWGAVLWFVSIFLLLTAAGTKELETKERRLEEPHEFLRGIGIALVVVTLAAAAYFAVSDRSKANATERERLSGLAFKRGKVCSVADPVPSRTLELQGPLELVMSSSPPWPFVSALALLEWGFPMIRESNLDYSLIPGKNFEAIRVTSAVGKASARLDASVNDKAGARLIRLTAEDGKATLFEQAWNIDPSTSFCPDYNSFPSRTQQPRQVLESALLPKPNSARLERVTDYGAEKHPGIHQWGVQSHEPFQIQARLNIENYNCPTGVGYNGIKPPNSGKELELPFSMADAYYYAGKSNFQHAICAEHLYIYSFRKNSSVLVISRRDSNSFAEEWTAFIDTRTSDEVSRLRIVGIKEDDKSPQIDLVNDTTFRGLRLTSDISTGSFHAPSK